MAVMNLATFPRTAPSRFCHQKHHATTEDLIQDIDTPTTKGTDHTPIMVPDLGDITADHSPSPIHTTTETAVLEGTHHALFQPPQQFVSPFSPWMLQLSFIL